MRKFILKNKDSLLFIGLLLLVAISRFCFLGGHIQFFDSSQYIWRSESKELISALTTGHAPYHPGYIFLTWLTNQFFHLFSIENTTLACAIPSALAGIAAIVFFYLLISKIFNHKIALLAAIIATFTPFFWISNISIIVDPTMIACYLASLYFFYLWLTTKNYWFVIISGFFLGYSMWAHTQIAFWSFGFIGLFFCLTKPKEWFETAIKSLPFLLGISFFIYIYLYLLVYSGHNLTYLSALQYLLGGNAGDHMPFSLMPGTKNYLVIITALLSIISIVGFTKMAIDKKYSQLFFLLVWLIPGLFVSALYLYANLFGRASMISIFPAAVAASYCLISWKAKNKTLQITQYLLIVLAVGQLLVIDLPIIWQYKNQMAPFEELAMLHKKLTPGGLYLTSNSAKTIYNYDNIDVVWEMPKSKISKDVKTTLEKKSPVYLGLDAITFANHKYDGYNWEIDSVGVGGPGEHESQVQYLFSQYNISLLYTSNFSYKTGIYEINDDNVDLKGRLTGVINNLGKDQTLITGYLFDNNLNTPVARNTLNFYSSDNQYIISPERINYRDAIYYLYNQLTYKINKNNNYREPLVWTLSDRSGYFSLPLPNKQANSDLSVVISTPNLSSSDIFPNLSENIQFTKQKDYEISVINKINGVVSNIDELVEILPQNKSYYLKLFKSNDKINYQINQFTFSCEQSAKLEAANIASDKGLELVDGSRFIAQGQSGYLAFGPWMSLPKGSYELTYRIKVSSTEGKDQLGKLEVTADDYVDSLTKKELSVADFKNDDYQDFQINFSTDTILEGVEFKLKSIGAANIFLESISFKKNN